MTSFFRPIRSSFRRRAWALACATLVAGPALAQWQWVDSSGNKVFSDMPPPAGIPEKNIVKRPGARAPAPVATPAAGSETASPEVAPVEAAAPKLSGVDPQLEAKKKQAEQAELTRKKAEAEKQAKARADTCERSQRAKRTLDSGIRLATTNAKGEREIMDDKTRATERERIEALIRANCGPAPAAPAQ